MIHIYLKVSGRLNEMVTIKRDRYVIFQIITNLTEINDSALKTTIWKKYQKLMIY